jgi:hypothetical protein
MSVSIPNDETAISTDIETTILSKWSLSWWRNILCTCISMV